MHAAEKPSTQNNSPLPPAEEDAALSAMKISTHEKSDSDDEPTGSHVTPNKKMYPSNKKSY